jgi:hypothetical protein
MLISHIYPDFLQVGSNFEEAISLLQYHQELLGKFQVKFETKNESTNKRID